MIFEWNANIETRPIPIPKKNRRFLSPNIIFQFPFPPEKRSFGTAVELLHKYFPFGFPVFPVIPKRFGGGLPASPLGFPTFFVIPKPVQILAITNSERLWGSGIFRKSKTLFRELRLSLRPWGASISRKTKPAKPAKLRIVDGVPSKKSEIYVDPRRYHIVYYTTLKKER